MVGFLETKCACYACVVAFICYFVVDVRNLWQRICTKLVCWILSTEPNWLSICDKSEHVFVHTHTHGRHKMKQYLKSKLRLRCAWMNYNYTHIVNCKMKFGVRVSVIKTMHTEFEWKQTIFIGITFGLAYTRPQLNEHNSAYHSVEMVEYADNTNRRSLFIFSLLIHYFAIIKFNFCLKMTFHAIDYFVIVLSWHSVWWWHQLIYLSTIFSCSSNKQRINRQTGAATGNARVQCKHKSNHQTKKKNNRGWCRCRRHWPTCQRYTRELNHRFFFCKYGVVYIAIIWYRSRADVHVSIIYAR